MDECFFAWTTKPTPLVVAGLLIDDGSSMRRAHICGEKVGSDGKHWGLHECLEVDCDEATSIDVYDPESHN